MEIVVRNGKLEEALEGLELADDECIVSADDPVKRIIGFAVVNEKGVVRITFIIPLTAVCERTLHLPSLYKNNANVFQLIKRADSRIKMAQHLTYWVRNRKEIYLDAISWWEDISD